MCCQPNLTVRSQQPNNGAAANRRYAGQLDDFMKFDCQDCIWESCSAAVAELTSEVIRQRFFQDFFTGFLKGLLPSSTLPNKVTSGLPLFLKAAS